MKICKKKKEKLLFIIITNKTKLFHNYFTCKYKLLKSTKKCKYIENNKRLS